MIDSIAIKLATRIKAENPQHPASVDVLRFSIAAVINVLGSIVISLTVALILGHVLETAVAMLAFGVLRAMSGGYHLNSSVACMLVTSAVANIIPYIPVSETGLYVAGGISIVLALLFATNNIENQTRIPKRYFPHLRVGAAILIATNFLIQSDAVAIAFLLQTLLLIKIGGEKE